MFSSPKNYKNSYSQGAHHPQVYKYHNLKYLFLVKYCFPPLPLIHAISDLSSIEYHLNIHHNVL